MNPTVGEWRMFEGSEQWGEVEHIIGMLPEAEWSGIVDEVSWCEAGCVLLILDYSLNELEPDSLTTGDHHQTLILQS